MKGFFQSIVDGFHGFWTQLLSLVVNIFTSVWTMLTDVFVYVFDKIMDFAISLISSLDFSSITQYASSSFSQVPSEVLNVLGLLGFADCMVVLTAALAIRVVLQLIPFVRLGS